ncbi:MAG: hypothetical protein OXQ90_05325 [Gammaproteobacteria bacterium]|nr:hypothetical protein [Gammaproteobacteria bacterium]
MSTDRDLDRDAGALATFAAEQAGFVPLTFTEANAVIRELPDQPGWYQGAVFLRSPDRDGVTARVLQGTFAMHDADEDADMGELIEAYCNAIRDGHAGIE